MPAYAIEGLTVSFGGKAPALDGVSFRVEAGELLVVLGGTGAGKTTLLRAIAGLQKPQRGRVLEEDGARGPAEYPCAGRIFDACMAIDAFSSTHPLKQPDAEG